jgi:predicted RNA binding protein YcfA (HicA-like mRNA interferase family)
LPSELTDEATLQAKEIEDNTFDSAFNDSAYDERHLRLQVARAINLLEKDGFVITIDMTIKSLEANGFVGSSESHHGSDYSELKRKLSSAALYNTQLEFHDGVLDPEDFGLEVQEHDRNYSLSGAYDCAYLGAPIVLGVKDLITFAQIA